MTFFLFISILVSLAMLSNSSRYRPHYTAHAPLLPPQVSPSLSPVPPVPPPSTDDDCATVLYDMVDCVPYLSAGGKNTIDPSCCDGFRIVLSVNPKCICEGLKNSAQLGIVLNMTRAALLPSACKVAAPSISDCTIALPPSGEAPVGPPNLSPTHGGNPSLPAHKMVPAPGPSKAGAYSISKSFLVLAGLLLVSISFIIA